MAYGDIHFQPYTSGSTSTSAAGAHGLFGIDQSVSLLNQNDVLTLQIYASGTPVRIWTPTVTNNTGFRLESTAMVEWPPVRAGAASLLSICREGTTNASVIWTAFIRNPL